MTSRKRGINIAYTAQYFKQIDVRIRTVTDFVVLPKMNSKETKCKLFVYSHPSMSLQKIWHFRTQPVFDLYDTNEEIGRMDIGDM